MSADPREAAERAARIDRLQRLPIYIDDDGYRWVRVADSDFSWLLQASAALRAAPTPVPEVSDDQIASLIHANVRLEWRGHDHASINPRSVTAAAQAIRAALTAALASTSAQDREGATKPDTEKEG